MKKDLFGYANQGVNYDIYRPTYSPQLLSKALAKLKAKNKYLDIATGTGQILFQLATKFTQSYGLDISKKMIGVCQDKISKANINNITVEVGDFMEWKTEDKFDLITIGQALHWFPIPETLQKAKNTLAEGGALGGYGYILKEITGATSNTEK